MIDVRPYTDAAAFAVFQCLDPYDLIEAELGRGQVLTPLGLFADWRLMQMSAHLSVTLHGAGGQAFAVMALVPGGPLGVAQAALLARPHRRWRRELVSAARRIGGRMPGFCQERSITRIEARSHAAHPTAGRFLAACGFAFEAPLPGYGPDGGEVFHQYAWTHITGEDPCAS